MEKGKILVDSNVLVSALVFDANELDALVLARRMGFRLLVSEHVLDEVRHVILDKFPSRARELSSFLNLSGLEGIERARYSHLKDRYPFLRDRADWHVIACAEATGCRLIVTGDKDLLSIGRHRSATIVNARSAIASIRAGRAERRGQAIIP